MLLLGLILGLGMATGTGLGAYGLASRLLPDAGLATRWTTAWVLALAWAATVSTALLWAGWFVLPVVAPLLLLPGVFARRPELPRLEGAERWIVGAALIVAGARALRGMVAPNLAWDGIGYHLPRAAMWVQHAGLWVFDGPGMIGPTFAYPPGLDVIWAAAMLPVHGDALLGLVYPAMWVGLPLAAAALARELGVERARAASFAVVIGWMPAMINRMSGGMVDPAATAAFCAAVVFVQRVSVTRSRTDAILLGIAAGLASVAKVSMVPLIGVVGFGMLLRAPWRLGWLLVGWLPLQVGAAWSWQRYGSPTWPFPLGLGPILVAPGDAYMVEMFRGTFGNGAVGDSLRYVLGSWVSPVPLIEQANVPGFGPVFAFLLLFLIPGLRTVARGPAPGVAFTLFAISGLSLLSVFSPDMYLQRTMHVYSLPRLLGHLPIAVAVFALVSGRLEGRPVWAVLAGVNVLLAVPRGWAWIDVVSTAALAAALVPFVWRPRLVPGAIGLLLVLDWARGQDLWQRWIGAEPTTAPFDFGRLEPDVLILAPVWDLVDDLPGARIAVVPTALRLTTVFYLWPLQGRHLQHELVYVPPTPDGRMPDLLLTRRGQAFDEDAWWSRLLDAETDYVLVNPPRPKEIEWTARADRFEPVAADLRGEPRLFRVLTSSASPRPRPPRTDPAASGTPPP